MDARPSKETPARRVSSPRNPERTRGAILAAAVAEFTSKGLSGARIDRIAKRARVNKRMIYYYFGDKERLYIAVLEETYTAIRTAEIGLTAAEAELTLSVVETYFDAALADQLLAIARTAVDQADSTLKHTQLQRAVGTAPEFELLRARVTRDNQRALAIQREADRDVAHLRLRQGCELGQDAPRLERAGALEERGLQVHRRADLPGQRVRGEHRGAMEPSRDRLAGGEDVVA